MNKLAGLTPFMWYKTLSQLTKTNHDCNSCFVDMIAKKKSQMGNSNVRYPSETLETIKI